MDWNWFFSSLAQSTAAIVGIFGAFIITKTLSNQGAFDSKRKAIRELAAKSQSLREEADDLPIEWYNERIAEWRAEDLHKRLDDGNDYATEDLCDELDFSAYQCREASIALIEQAIADYKCRKEAEEADALERSRQMFDIRGPKFRDFPSITSHFEAGSVNSQKAEIDVLMRRCKQHIRVVEDILSAVAGNPEHSPQITYTLLLVLILFYVGVIYPLSFTPVMIDAPISLSLAAFIDIALSIKGLLLSLVSVVFTIVIGMFFVMNIRMRYASDEIERLKGFSRLRFYSRYFEIAENNRSQGEA